MRRFILKPYIHESTTASVKAALPALARRWLSLHEELQNHDEELGRLVAACAPELLASLGIATMTVAEMLILIGDDPQESGPKQRWRNYAAFVQSRHPVEKSIAFGSTAAATGKPMQPSIALPSTGCAITSHPSPTSKNA